MDVRWVNVSQPPSFTTISSFDGDGCAMTAHGRLTADRATDGEPLPPEGELLPPAEHPASTADRAITAKRTGLTASTTTSPEMGEFSVLPM
jgi:hypothetical protein